MATHDRIGARVMIQVVKVSRTRVYYREKFIVSVSVSQQTQRYMNLHGHCSFFNVVAPQAKGS